MHKHNNGIIMAINPFLEKPITSTDLKKTSK